MTRLNSGEIRDTRTTSPDYRMAALAAALIEDDHGAELTLCRHGSRWWLVDEDRYGAVVATGSISARGRWSAE